MSYYQRFLEARDLVLANYPSAVCKYTYNSFKVYEDNNNESYINMLAQSELNEPMAWIAAAQYIELDFLWKLEQ